MTPICPYCNKQSEQVTGYEIYPHRPDLCFQTFYRCSPCNAYVGCHPQTNKPLGTLANAELRALRSQVHAAFDPIWKKHTMKRTEAYLWLAETLKISFKECHIGMFNKDLCERALTHLPPQKVK
jgi:hypothetical protein